MWGELASHQRPLTHRPSSQGWASKCLLYPYVDLSCFFCLGLVFHDFVVLDYWVILGGWVAFLPP